MPVSQTRRALRIAAAVLGVVMMMMVVQALRRDGPAALDAWRAARVRWSWIAAAVLCAFTGHAIYLLGWRRLLADSQNPVSLWQLARMFLVSNLGRYVPGGKAWQMAIIGMMSAERGLSATTLAASSLFQGIVGVVVGMIILFAAGGALLGLAATWLVLPIAGVVGLLFVPVLVRSLPRLHAVVIQRVAGIDSVTPGTMWTLIWTSAASWIMWGTALRALAEALLASTEVSVGAFVAAWTGSFLAGLVAIVSPAGLGAREGAMQLILERAGMAPASVLIVVVVARAGVTVLDIVPALVVLASSRKRG